MQILKAAAAELLYHIVQVQPEFQHLLFLIHSVAQHQVAEAVPEAATGTEAKTVASNVTSLERITRQCGGPTNFVGWSRGLKVSRSQGLEVSRSRGLETMRR